MNIALVTLNQELLLEYVAAAESYKDDVKIVLVGDASDFMNPEIGNIDYVFALGGDGTVLAAANLAIRHGAQMIGINEGTLGFMSFQFPSSPALKAIMNPGMATFHQILDTLLLKDRRNMNLGLRVERRMLLKVDNIDGWVVNEIAILGRKPGIMTDIPLYANGQLLSRYQGDGLVISTPSGSTAYNLSAGGPILHVDSEMIAITPIAPFSLSSRPIVLPANIELTFKMTDDLVMVLDGHDHWDGAGMTHDERSVTINMPSQKMRLLRPRDVSFLDTCREKLQWRNHTKG